MYVLYRTIASAGSSVAIGGWISAIKIVEDAAAALPMMMRPVWRSANNCINPFALSAAPQARSRRGCFDFATLRSARTG
jgi:hypothetical protein